MERKRSSDRVSAPPSRGIVTELVMIRVGSLSLRELRLLGPVQENSGAGRPKASHANTTSSVSFTVEFIELSCSSTGSVGQMKENRQLTRTTKYLRGNTCRHAYTLYNHQVRTAQGLHLPLTVSNALAEVVICSDTSSLLAVHEYIAVSENSTRDKNRLLEVVVPSTLLVMVTLEGIGSPSFSQTMDGAGTPYAEQESVTLSPTSCTASLGFVTNTGITAKGRRQKARHMSRN